MERLFFYYKGNRNQDLLKEYFIDIEGKFIYQLHSDSFAVNFWKSKHDTVRHFQTHEYKFWINGIYVHKEKGIKVMYHSDGDYTEFIDDIALAGADGFGLENYTSLDYVAKKYGNEKFFWGNADCRILQFGTKEEIKNEVKRCVDIGKEYPGYFFGFPNTIPNNISLENIEYFYECFEELRERK